MKVLHISPTYYPATSFGGPIFSLYGLCNALSRKTDIELKVLTTNSSGLSKRDILKVPSKPVSMPFGYDVLYCRKMLGAEFSPLMFAKMWNMISWADLVHLTGVYSPPTIPTLLLCRLFNKPVVWSPRGSLQRWERETRRSEKKVWEAICNHLCRPSKTILHVTSKEELEASASRIPRAGAFALVNGVELPEDLPTRVWRQNGVLRLMFLGRLHPIKGIENLLHALSQIKSKVTLDIFGDGTPDYKETLAVLVAKLGLKEIVKFHGWIAPDKKTAIFNHADVCMVPSFSENFSMTVVESLAHGVPVIASKGTPWASLESKGCGLWVENDPASLSDAILSMCDKDLCEMGKIGRSWMQEDFSWDHIASEMYQKYRALIK